MRAMVMAAGVGSRLRPLTVNVPKPMVPILNKPAMEHIITLLRRHGINEIVANLSYSLNTSKDTSVTEATSA